MFESIKFSTSVIRTATGYDMIGYTACGFDSAFMAQVAAFMVKTALSPTAPIAKAASSVYPQLELIIDDDEDIIINNKF